MNCSELSDSYELYALGLLEGPERDAIEEHVGRNCENCMKEINRAVENNALVFRAVPKLDPPNRLRTRILAGFGLETRPLWVRVLPWSVALASVVLLVVIATYPARQNSVVEFLSTPGTRQVSFGGTGPRGSVLMQQQKGILLVVVNLPAAPAGQMYETWIVPPVGGPKPMGQMETARNGDAVARIPGPIDLTAVKAVAVSLEPAGSHPVTPTQVVFAAPISGS